MLKPDHSVHSTKLDRDPAIEARESLSVALRRIVKRFGGTTAVDDVSLEIKAGEFISLLGPSGSGKTTLLMMLAGFEEPSSGQIILGSNEVTHLAPNRRNIGMVFQSYALFPHMTVGDNIAFPLRMRGIKRAERLKRVEETLALVRLDGLQNRMPRQLSGGQQQRVALARAIVFRPAVILMDEPLGALDKKLREYLQLEIKRLQRRLNATVAYVTHDQSEALTMSDRIAVMNHGQILQVGPPRDLYHRPSSAFVANFLGEMNFLAGSVVAIDGGKYTVDLGGAYVEAAPPVEASRWGVGSAVRVAVRPEQIKVMPSSDVNGPRVRGVTREIIFNGASLTMLIQLSTGAAIRADVKSDSPSFTLRPGDAVDVEWNVDATLVFDEGN